MAVNRSAVQFVYGMGDNLLQLPPQPIVTDRAPTTRDLGQLGQLWVDRTAGIIYGLASITANAANWTATPAAGATTLASLIVNPGNATVTAGNLAVTAGDLTVGGNTNLTGTLTVGGLATFNGDFDLTSAALIDLTSSLNAAPSIYLHANGGVNEQILLHSDQGTAVDSVSLLSDVGGITLQSGLASADAININAAAGGVDVDAALLLSLSSSRNNAQAILVEASAGGIDILASGATAGEDIDIVATGSSVNINSTENVADSVVISSTNGGIDILANGAAAGEDIDLQASSSINLLSTEDAAQAIYLRANGGTSETIQLHADQGTAVNSINLLSDVGGLTLRSTGLASADAINLEAAAGGVDIDGALQVNIASSQAAVANSVRIVASAADGGIDIDAGTGGITIDSTGAFSIDGAAASNVTTTGAGIDLTLSSVLGSVLVSSTEDAALAIRLHANGGTSETIQLHSDQGTGVGSINLLSDVGGITLTATGLASADAINLEATAGGIDMDSALQTNIASSQAAATALRLNASDAAGGIDVDAGTGGIAIDTTGALSLDSAAASNFTVTGAFDLTLSSSAGSVIVQGAEAAADAVQITASNAAGGLDLNAGTGGVAVDAVGGSIALTAGTGANGSITLTSTGTGDIVLNSDDTMLLDADGVLELNSSAGAINIGNDADAQAINIGSAGARPIQLGNATAGTTVLLLGPANVGVTLQNSIRIMTGAGSPDTVVTAPAGSLWLRTDPAGATSRIYVNTDSATAWTNVTCAA